MVWLVDPEARTLELHQPDAAPQMLSGDDVVEGGATLPGFRVKVSELFPDSTSSPSAIHIVLHLKSASRRRLSWP